MPRPRRLPLAVARLVTALAVATALLVVAAPLPAQPTPDPAAAPAAATPSAAAAANPYVSLPQTRADVLVTARFVLQVKMEGAGVEQDVEGEATCVMIDPRGLALCSNIELGGYFGLLGRMMGAGGDLTATPKSLRLVAGPAEKEYEAQLVTRDSDRDLAWVKVLDRGETTFPALDFGAAAEAGAGDMIYLVRRMDDFFGEAAVVRSARVTATVTKPRRLLIPEEPIGAGFGLPVYTADGRVVGLLVLQMPGEEDQADLFENPLTFLGQAARLQDMVGGVVLPAADVVRATTLARETFAEDFELE